MGEKKLERKTKSIKNSLIIVYTLLILIICSVLTTISITVSKNSLENTALNMIPEIAARASEAVTNTVKNYFAILENSASFEIVGDPNVSMDRKFSTLESERVRMGADTMVLVTLEGNTIGKDGKSANISDRDYFKQALQGETNISTLSLNSVSKKMKFNVATPVKYNDEITYVLMATFMVDRLMDMTSKIKIAETGTAYIIDENGTTISHKDLERVMTQENIIEMAKNDKSLEPLANIFKEMIKGGQGIASYTFGGEKIVMAYHNIENTKWSFAVNVPLKEITKETGKLNTMMIITCIICVMIGILITYTAANNLINPIIGLTKRVSQLRDGDLSTQMVVEGNKSELKTLGISLKETIDNIRNYIEDIHYVLDNIGKGNLNVEPQYEYKGDFIPIKESLEYIIKNLNNTLNGVMLATNEVANGAEQVSLNSISLSDTATQQATSIEEITATIIDVSNQITINNKATEEVNQLALQAMKETKNGSKNMEAIVIATKAIQTASNEIAEIIKNINDIATQTNLLALNAAIEAARAGDAGKGFNVVATEVRELAEKSLVAADKTTQLVKTTIDAVEKGVVTIDKTIHSLNDIFIIVEKVTTSITKVTNTSSQQSQAINEVTNVIDDISQVVQATAVTAEKSSNTSKNMSKQAELLRDRVATFKLK